MSFCVFVSAAFDNASAVTTTRQCDVQRGIIDLFIISSIKAPVYVCVWELVTPVVEMWYFKVGLGSDTFDQHASS